MSPLSAMAYVGTRRRNRPAAARREQEKRKEARVVQSLLAGFDALSMHRGCQPTKLGSALANLLRLGEAGH